MTPTREEFMHLAGAQKTLFYILIFVSIGIGAYQVWQRSRVWMQGKKIDWKPMGIPGILRYIFGQKKVRTSRRKSGAPMHLMMFYGFVSLIVATTLLAINTYSPWKFHQGTYYLVYELTFDLLGLLFVVGVGWAMVRRMSFRPLSMGHNAGDWWALALLFTIGVTGYLLEAARIANDPKPWDMWSIVGYTLAQPLMGLSNSVYVGIWWFHMVWVFVLFAVLPRMRIRHLVMATMSAYGFNEKQPWGELMPISMEEVEQTGQIGVTTAKDYSRWHLMSLDACMECGRCTDVCPANGAGKILNPKQVVQDIRAAMVSGENVADKVSEEALWACTTCNACVEACPVLIRHVDLIVDARRNLVAEGKFAGTGAVMLRQLASTSSAWGQASSSREDWMKGLDIPLCRSGAEFEYLLWVGCAGATDPAAMRTTKAFANLLQRAGVKFACLGQEEMCTGDPARRVGDEFLFQEKAMTIVEVFKAYGVKKVLTACPHCMNTLKNEYHQFEGNLEVWHHTQFLQKLIGEGKIKGAKLLPGSTTLHDPCYLARVNNEADAPRSILGESTSLNNSAYPTKQSTMLVEPEKLGRKTLCCGAGGGRMFMEEPIEQRPGDRRADELLATGAKQIAVACPFCRIMLDVSVKQKAGDDVQLVDVAELVAQAND